ncbi:hypothetical protein [Candidatus Laterigemmans baculatus]|uniref:hypothetical protein n=1 Tax=Candidatus Laterigemmans baculatus TaxID=2770505 RepID=UPI0013DB2D36|nr:hypothetical protein [Candidatus Laterigemmans baculatus]
MNHAALVETLRPLPRVGRVRIAAQIDRLRRICDDTQPLETFLEEVLDVLRRVFGAAAASVWFRTSEASTLQPASRIGFDSLAFSAAELASLDEAVLALCDASEPLAECFEELPAAMLVGPIHGPRDSTRPSESPEMSETARTSETPGAVGAFQLVITDIQPSWGDDWDQHSSIYLPALRSVLVALQPEMLRRMRVSHLSISEAHQGLERLGQQIHGIQRSIRLAIEHHLQQHAGATFGSFDENLQFLRSIHQLLDAHGLRVRCPECGHPAILRCARNASVRAGVFMFDHYLPSGRTFHGGGAVLPTLRVVAKPERRKSTPGG